MRQAFSPSSNNALVRFFLKTVVFILCAGGSLTAQSALSTIRGTVTDQSKAVVPGVEVMVTDMMTNVRARMVITDDNGNFEIPDLKPGTYRLAVEMPGFKTFVADNIALESGQARRIDAVMQVGESTEHVTVEAGAALITTEGGTIAGAITAEQFKDVPQVDTQSPYPGPYGLLTTLPGVQGAGWNVSISGQRSSQISAQDDGVQNDRTGNQSVNIYTYDELKVVTVNNTADQARAASFNATSKHGTNAWHGMASYKHTNSALGARSFFDPEKTPYKFHDFYADAGGPIIKDKTFFYVGWTHIRVPAGSFILASVPTLKMRQGDFSQFSRTIIDPLTGQAFPNNIIPANRQNDTSLKVQEIYIPKPNLGGPDKFSNNHGYNFPYPDDYFLADYPLFRVDHNLTKSNSLFFRYQYYWSPYILAQPLPGFARTRTRYHDKGVLSDTHVLSPLMVNTFRFGFNGNKVRDGITVDNFTPPKGNEAVSKIGLKGVNPRGLSAMGFPRMDFSGVTSLTSLRAIAGGTVNDEYDFSYEDSLTWSRDRHVWKFGVQYNKFNSFRSVVDEGTYGRFSFNGSFTGIGYADFLLGIPRTSVRLDPLLDRWRRAGELALYAMDTFKVSQRLNIDYGLRWDYFISPTFDDGLQLNWDPQTGNVIVPQAALSRVSPLYPKFIKIVTGSVVPREARNDFRPRFGFAYRLQEDLVIRGGYGLYTERLDPFNRLQGGGPFQISESYTNRIENGRPLFTFPEPFPASLALASIPSQSVSGYPIKTRNGVIHQFNLSVEKEVASLGFRVSYVGSRSRGLNYPLNLNKPRPSLTPFTTDRRPYPQFVGATFIREDGESRYDALQLEAKRRMGLITFNANYTWACNLHNFLNTENPYDVTSNWGRDDFTQRQRAVVTSIIELPFGRGRRYLSDAPGVVDQILGGWKIQTMSFFATGAYFSPAFSGSDPSNTNTFGGLPDRVADGNLSRGRRGVDRWFDSAAFKAPPNGRFGNSGVNVLQGPGMNVHHLALVKRFQIRERYSVTYNAGISNIFNHPHFVPPVNDITSPDAGQLVSVPEWNPEKTNSRRMQMQLRFEW